jgi:CNT family concentrative nucleoside transporter
MAVLSQFQGLIGLAMIILLAWVGSENRRHFPRWGWVLGALALQLGLALVITKVPVIWTVINFLNSAVKAIETATLVGSSYMFGYTGGAPIPFVLKAGEGTPMVLAFQILPLVIVFSALSAVLWHWGILAVVVRGFSWALKKTLGVSGVVGLAGGASIFLGVVEAPMVLKAYFDRLSRSELFAIMVLIMSTISGAILVLYAQTLSQTVPNAVGHMISASIISLPAAILVARIMVPPGDAKASSATVDEGKPDLKYDNTMDAVIRGTMDGIQLFLAVIGVIIVIFALVTLVDMALAHLPFVQGGPLTLRRLLGWVFAPFMWTLGVPWEEAPQAGALMGTKTILNEYVAYMDFAKLPEGTFAPRSQLIITYALCGVANLASVGLLISTIGTLAPERKAELSALGMKSWLAGNAATAMTGAIIGLITLV